MLPSSGSSENNLDNSSKHSSSNTQIDDPNFGTAVPDFISPPSLLPSSKNTTKEEET